MQDTVLSVSEFIGLLNQTLEYSYPLITVEGEVSSFRISKNRWLYFDIKDDQSKLSCFGSVYQMQQPIEDGMLVKVVGSPRHHQLYGFSFNAQKILPSGEGTIKRAQELLRKKLEAEGLFDPQRKRPLPEFPATVGLITSAQAAAFADFNKTLNQRWGGLEVQFLDVLVQGESAPNQLVAAISHFNQQAQPVDVLVMIRGGGSIEDLQAFSTEPVARAVAASRSPIVVGVGHETDISLADLAADYRAATPTAAAQAIVPSRDELITRLNGYKTIAASSIQAFADHSRTKIDNHLLKMSHALRAPKQSLDAKMQTLSLSMHKHTELAAQAVRSHSQLLNSLNPKNVMSRGYSIVRSDSGKILKSATQTKAGERIVIEFSKDRMKAEIIDEQV